MEPAPVERIKKLTEHALTIAIPAVTAIFVLLVGVASAFFHAPDHLFRFAELAGLAAVLSYLVMERRTFDAARSPAEIAVHGPWFDTESIHMAAMSALRDAHAVGVEDRVILITTLPGHAGAKRGGVRYNVGGSAAPTYTPVQQQLHVKITAQPPWHVKHLVNITSMEQLASLERWLNSVVDASTYELHAHSTDASLLVLAPLVIANTDLFLAAEDAAREQLGSAVRLSGRAAAAWGTAYFNELFDTAPYRVRSRRGINPEELARLRAAVTSRLSGEAC